MNFLDNKPVQFRLSSRRAKPALTGRYYPMIKRVPSEEEIYDPKTNKKRIMRYAVGESSIWKEDQPKKVVLTDIIFSNGTIQVEFTNPTLLEFLEKSNHNADNPNRIKSKRVYFEEVNTAKNAKETLDEESLRAEAIIMLRNLEINDLKGYARVLGVNINNTVDEIKHDLLTYAKKKPAEFMTGLDDPSIKMQQLILDGLEQKLLMQQGRAMYWDLGGGKKGLIISSPIGKKVVEYMADWIISDKDGDKVRKELIKKLK